MQTSSRPMIRVSTFTPVAMMGVDPFVLWVHKNKGINSFEDWQAKVKEANGEWVMGGTGKGQEDSIVTTWLAAITPRMVSKLLSTPSASPANPARAC